MKSNNYKCIIYKDNKYILHIYNVYLIEKHLREVYMKSYILKNVDPKLWQEVKILAIKKRTTIRELIIELLEQAVKKGGIDI